MDKYCKNLLVAWDKNNLFDLVNAQLTTCSSGREKALGVYGLIMSRE